MESIYIIYNIYTIQYIIRTVLSLYLNLEPRSKLKEPNKIQLLSNDMIRTILKSTLKGILQTKLYFKL